MSRSDETLLRQWIMLARIPRFPRKITVSALKDILQAEGYIVDTRTIQRDLNKLSSTFPLSNDSEGRTNYWFCISDAPIQDIPGMEPVTALAFEMAESYLQPLLPRATLDLLQPYFNRARDVLASQSTNKLSKWSDKVAVIERGPVLQTPSIEPDVQNTIYQALLEEKTIQACYHSRNSDIEKDYIIHPLGIVSRAGVIYLVCTLREYGDIKQLALHRFISATIEDIPIRQPAGFSLQNYIEKENQFSYRVEDKPIQLKVKFEEKIAAHLAEAPLAEGQVLTPQNDGTILLEVDIVDTLELRWWLQGFGDNVEVLEPLALREKFKAVSLSLSRKYQKLESN